MSILTLWGTDTEHSSTFVIQEPFQCEMKIKEYNIFRKKQSKSHLKKTNDDLFKDFANVIVIY